jgi:hypothetical protein
MFTPTEVLRMEVKFSCSPLANAPPPSTKAPSRLNSESLTDILYMLGFTKEEQNALLEEGED